MAPSDDINWGTGFDAGFDGPSMARALCRLTGDEDWLREDATVRGTAAHGAVLGFFKTEYYRHTPWRRTEGARSLRTGAMILYPEPMNPELATADLAEAGLYPWMSDDPNAPGWWCDPCESTGYRPGWIPCECCGDGRCPADCDIEGNRTYPVSMDEILTVTALGLPRLRMIRELVDQLCHTLARPSAFCWRSLSLEEMQRHHRKEGPNWQTASNNPAILFSLEVLRRGDDKWTAAFPFQIGSGPWRSSWPILRALALEAGVHLLDATDRVVIGVQFQPTHVPVPLRGHHAESHQPDSVRRRI